MQSCAARRSRIAGRRSPWSFQTAHDSKTDRGIWHETRFHRARPAGLLALGACNSAANNVAADNSVGEVTNVSSDDLGGDNGLGNAADTNATDANAADANAAGNAQ